MNTHPTQSAAILRTLQEHAPSWVAMPLLAEASGAYAVHSRISELRKRGHQIKTRVDRSGTAKRSFYALEEVKT